MIFATGAITGIHPIGPGQRCRVEVRGGPSVELRTADRHTLVLGRTTRRRRIGPALRRMFGTLPKGLQSG